MIKGHRDFPSCVSHVPASEADAKDCFFSKWASQLCPWAHEELQQLVLQLQQRRTGEVHGEAFDLWGHPFDWSPWQPPCPTWWRMLPIVPASPPSFHLNYLCPFGLVPSQASVCLGEPGRHAHQRLQFLYLPAISGYKAPPLLLSAWVLLGLKTKHLQSTLAAL